MRHAAEKFCFPLRRRKAVFRIEKLKSAVMADEIAALVTKFNQLKKSGQKAFLWLECQDGRSFVTLQVHLQPCEEPQPPHLRRGEAHHVCRGHVQSNRRARKAAPSRLRRRELRAAERAAGASAACLKIPPSPLITPLMHKKHFQV